MIPAPANVLGRLSTILMDEEDLLKVTHRDDTHRAIAEFLGLYYDGRKTIPPDETNGNNPVSRYKVATDAWRQLDLVFKRTGDARAAATRDVVARVLPTGKPDTVRDLAAQTIGLCLSDPGGTGPRSTRTSPGSSRSSSRTATGRSSSTRAPRRRDADRRIPLRPQPRRPPRRPPGRPQGGRRPADRAEAVRRLVRHEPV